MKHVMVIPKKLEQELRHFMFQNELEQCVFLFSRLIESTNETRMEAVDAYFVPPDGWEVQHEAYLEMTDAERAKIMKIARDGDFAVIDCHSHPGSGNRVWFSPSDRHGISEFALYAKWKLDGKPYTAMVWGESSVDAVTWCGDFTRPQRVDEVLIIDRTPRILNPRGTWFGKPHSYQKEKKHGR